MSKSLPVYTSVLLRDILRDEREEVILAKDSREDTSPLWVHITSSGDYNTYPLRAFKTIYDFKCFVRYSSAHGK